MRYLIFGDVHGNLPALEKMLEAERGNYELLISHGDVVNYGPWSNECVDLLNELNCICLTGNHEENYLSGNYAGKNIVARSFFDFCFLSFQKQEIIKKYSTHHDLSNYRIIHTINNQYIFPDTDLSEIHIDRNYIFGHSHYQFSKDVNGFMIHNTGSVGQNRKYINVINYLIYDDATNEVFFKKLKYDVDLILNEMFSRNYPEICINYYRNKEQL